MSAATKKILCQLDGAEVHHLATHLKEQHGLSLEEYLRQFPETTEVVSGAVSAEFETRIKGIVRRAAPSPEKLTATFGKYVLPMHHDVPESACLPLPPHYHIPTEGQLAQDIARVVRHWKHQRSMWIWGPPGSGKDATISALCALTRTPSAIFPVNPDTDIMAWFHDKSFDHAGTRWDEGELFRCLVYGFENSQTNTRVPMTIVLSDIDRAGRSQAEAFRLVTDSIAGRVKGPRGETYPVLPGTRIIATANTMGTGDASGKCVSANVLDMSILDRIERKVRFHHMDWADEEKILRVKFPIFASKCGPLMPKVMAITAALRRAVDSEDLYGEFSHRSLCAWVGDCEDILQDYFPNVPEDLLKQGFFTFVDGLGDETTRRQAQTLASAHIPLLADRQPQKGPLRP